MPPTSNPVTDEFNVGTDISLIFQFANGLIVPFENLAHLMSFSSKREKELIKKKPCSKKGKVLRRVQPEGYMVTIKALRNGGNLSNVFLTLDQNFYANGRNTKFAISGTVRNPEGGADTYLWTEMVFDDFDFGQFEGTDGVEQELTAYAQECIPQKATPLV